MGLFGFGRKNDVVDLTEKYKRQKEMQASMSQDSVDAIVNQAGSQTQGSKAEVFNPNESPAEKRRKLAKRILDMTTRIEDLSNKTFLLQQRIELLEKKVGLGNPDSA